MARHRLGTVRFGLVALVSLALLGCQQGTTGGGSRDTRGTGIETGGGQQEPGRPSPEACLSPDTVGATTPTGEVFFPPEGATVGLGEIAFLWSASDREDNNLLVTVQVSDQPDVFGAPAASERVCTGPQTGLGRTPVTFTAAGVFYWGVEITDGVNTVQRPADGVGVRFEVSPQGPGSRRGIEDATLLCPRDTLPARAATTFQWVLGDVQPTRTQVFVSRAGRESPFDSPLRVFEVTPPTATSRAISEADALPLGVELCWGLRMETTQAVLFTFEGQLGVSFVVEDNVPPSGVLLGPEDGAVWADHTEVFPLSWDADPGNCEDGLTSTVYFELLNGADQPTNLFNSPLQLEVGQASLEVNLVAESQELSLGGGLWAWGVLADDGTDVAERRPGPILPHLHPQHRSLVRRGAAGGGAVLRFGASAGGDRLCRSRRQRSGDRDGHGDLRSQPGSRVRELRGNPGFCAGRLGARAGGRRGVPGVPRRGGLHRVRPR